MGKLSEHAPEPHEMRVYFAGRRNVNFTHNKPRLQSILNTANWVGIKRGMRQRNTEPDYGTGISQFGVATAHQNDAFCVGIKRS